MTNTLNDLHGERWIDTGGEGPVLLLIHGIGGTTASWLPVIDSLARAGRVVAWTFPGYDGAAPLASETPSSAAYAARALGLMDDLGIASAAVCGHSLGSIVAADLARIAPERVESLTLICPVSGFAPLPAEKREAIHDGRANEIRDGGMDAFAKARTGSIVGPTVTEADLAGIIATMAAVPDEAYLTAWRMLCDSDILATLAPYEGPAAVIGGAVDPVAPVASVEVIAEQLGVSARILADVGHFPMHEATEALLALLEPPAR
ncbi:hypothetical protein DLJ53_25245 [Acuticoccus sediminis]|uniref:AB hydrolase-1 domain-containing protein n=1 Tax=Acuticoccus sediminis TaxID=2184697 RepID=A0A8B2NPC0_9HYPH|nr:alpha/beta fold hydrolase [Acuticoccus sediminis]RAH98939.1 hypothetical protein DLJ53_25245 [Acuticoccus sediminis]